ncbi:hypothetical protein BS329_37055 [Amycolatopsis coloradensis]|uniref:HTH arsR-type domain-containing protein n=1 Tax=Amycolatopsis coloradensis TaxID=76021 RepID=A0A1R0KFR8_9PSEU|nr:helix-turn-helix transcriptional regulator [Amycolatopsis coloradensis]OLZ44287.1 hypothetical protein BS329_37055 [Amycolatopsis coloradensis]
MDTIGSHESTGDVDIAAIAALFGDPARARILLALASGQEMIASALAAEAGLSAQATSAHLRKLLDAGLIMVIRRSRYRCYRIARAEVASALESLARLAPSHPVRSLRQSRHGRALRFARICYNHLAGQLAIAIGDALIRQEAIIKVPTPDERDVEETWIWGPNAPQVLNKVGIRACLTDAHAAGSVPVRTCYDWSARRQHLAGSLGASLLTAMLDRGWLTKIPGQRAVHLTDDGWHALETNLFTDACPPLPCAQGR